MFRAITLALASSSLVAAVASHGTPSAAVLASAQGAASTGAQYGTFGFDTAGMDRSVLPGDDFYQFANGTWAKNNPVPADKSNFGASSVLDDLSHERTRGILDEARNDSRSRIGIAYATFLDTDLIEKKGLAPIQPWLNQIRSLKSKSGYAALLARADAALYLAKGTGRDRVMVAPDLLAAA